MANDSPTKSTPSMDWLNPLTGVLGSIGSGISSIWQVSQQRKENEKNRQFNAEQAQLSRMYNTQMVNAQNDYNSPSAQMQRLQQAGLNPNLVYGQLGNMSVGIGSTSQQGSSNGSVGSHAPDLGSLSTIGMNMAQTKLMEAEADKVKEETEGQRLANYKATIENKYFEQFQQQGLAKGQAGIELDISAAGLNDEQKKYYAKQLVVLDETIEDIKSSVAVKRITAQSIEQDVIGKKMQNQVYERTMDAMVERAYIAVQKDYADLNFTKAQTKEILTLMSFKAALYNAQTIEAHAHAHEYGASTEEKYQNIENLKQGLRESAERVNKSIAERGLIAVVTEQGELQLKLDKRYGDAQRILGCINQLTSSIADVGVALNPVNAIFGRRPARVGFR